MANVEMLKLETERLTIRPIQLVDAEFIYGYRSDWETNQYQGWIPDGKNEVSLFIKNKVASKLDEPDTWFQLAILLKETNDVIGDIGIHFLADSLQVELGCTLAKSYHQKGLATEAMKSVISFLFLNLKKHRITLSIDPRNKASVNLAANLKFRKEAHFIQSIYVNGIWVDDIVYALLKSEWQIE